MMQNTTRPQLQLTEPISSPTIFIVCGLLGGVFITAMLFFFMICKLKLHTVRASNHVQNESKLMGVKSKQHRSEVDSNLRRWRSGYGDEEAGFGSEDESGYGKIEENKPLSVSVCPEYCDGVKPTSDENNVFSTFQSKNKSLKGKTRVDIA